MPIIVENPPSPSALMTTADIPERQVLINGRHHILWEEVETNRWVVTTPEWRIVVLSLQGAEVVPLSRAWVFPVRGRPFLALAELSFEDWETQRSAALCRAQTVRSGGEGPPPLPSGYAPVGHCWRRLRGDEEFVYDHATPCPELPGYAVDLVLRGHEFCRCLRSASVKWFLPHSTDRSSWPWAFRRVELYVADLLRYQPYYVAMGYSSYGFIVTEDMFMRRGGWVLRTPNLQRRVGSRLQELAEMAAAARLPPTARPTFAAIYRGPPQDPTVPTLAVDPFSDSSGEPSEPMTLADHPATEAWYSDTTPTWVDGVGLAQERLRATFEDSSVVVPMQTQDAPPVPWDPLVDNGSDRSEPSDVTAPTPLPCVFGEAGYPATVLSPTWVDDVAQAQADAVRHSHSSARGSRDGERE